MAEHQELLLGDFPYRLQGYLQFLLAVRLADEVGSAEMIGLLVEPLQVELLYLELLVMPLLEPDYHRLVVALPNSVLVGPRGIGFIDRYWFAVSA